MDGISFSPIDTADRFRMEQLETLLAGTGIRRDKGLDYIAGAYDKDFNLLATGACLANTLRCLAVDASRQGEGLMASMVSHLVDHQISRGNTHLFLYTHRDKAPIFANLGFYEIAGVSGEASFMENRRSGFADYLQKLASFRREGANAALVMNCNPFTLGHRYLLERAAAENDTVHLFVVSEDVSFIPFADRYRLVKEGCADLPNVILHQTGSYMISGAVFPAYFLEDEDAAIDVQARLDLQLFGRIADALGVTRRYVGEEPYSRVTGMYNRIMAEQLPAQGLECVIIPRLEVGGLPVSASRVRQLIHDGYFDAIRELTTPVVFGYFSTEAGKAASQRIREAADVKHY